VRTSDSRRSRPAADIRLGVPPPMKMVWILRPQISGSDISRSARTASRYSCSGKRAVRLVRIEIAVRALAHAPGPVDVQRQRRQRRQVQRAGLQVLQGAWAGERGSHALQVAPGFDRDHFSFSTSARRAWPRCDRRSFRRFQLGHGLAQRPGSEVRIVAEAVVAARGVDRFRRASAVGDHRLRVVGMAHVHQHAVVVGRFVLVRGQVGDQLFVVARVRLRLAGIARRVSRRARRRGRSRTRRNRRPGPAGRSGARRGGPFAARFRRRCRKGSSASGTLNSPCGCSSKPIGASSWANSLSLPALLEARMRRWVMVASAAYFTRSPERWQTVMKPTL
jgi:hypothetical protein